MAAITQALVVGNTMSLGRDVGELTNMICNHVLGDRQFLTKDIGILT